MFEPIPKNSSKNNFLLSLNHYIEFANVSLLKKPKTYLYPFLKNLPLLIYDIIGIFKYLLCFVFNTGFPRYVL